MKLITDADDITLLRTRCEDFDFLNPPFDVREIGKQMIELMYELNGLGLAANQVGIPYRIFVMRGTPERGNYIVVNPSIVNLSNETIVLEESCLSFPGLIIKIKRPRHARLRFRVPTGETYTEQFVNLTARCVQHELDHLNGELFYQRANKYHRDLAFRQRGKNVQKAMESNSQTSFQNFRIQKLVGG